MDDSQKSRLTALLHAQKRRERAPAVIGRWKERGVVVSVLSDAQQEAIVSWLQQNWRTPDQHVADFAGPLASVVAGEDLVVVSDFWQWERAVTVLVPAKAVLTLEHDLRSLYPDGFLVANQAMTRGLLVDFQEEYSVGAHIHEILA